MIKQEYNKGEIKRIFAEIFQVNFIFNFLDSEAKLISPYITCDLDVL